MHDYLYLVLLALLASKQLARNALKHIRGADAGSIIAPSAIGSIHPRISLHERVFRKVYHLRY